MPDYKHEATKKSILLGIQLAESMQKAVDMQKQITDLLRISYAFRVHAKDIASRMFDESLPNTLHKRFHYRRRREMIANLRVLNTIKLRDGTTMSIHPPLNLNDPFEPDLEHTVKVVKT